VNKKIFLLTTILIGAIAFCAYFLLINPFSCKAENLSKEIVITADRENKAQSETAEVEEFEVITKEAPEGNYDFSDLSHWNLTVSGWENLAEKDYKAVFAYTKKCLELYEEKAREMAKEMKRFVTMGHEDDYALCNDVATSHFIMGEAYMRQEKYDKALTEFNLIINEYPYAQCWDPKGWFWKVAEISRKNIEKIKKIEEEKKVE